MNKSTESTKLQVSESVSLHHKVYIKICCRLPWAVETCWNCPFPHESSARNLANPFFKAANFRKAVTKTSTPSKVSPKNGTGDEPNLDFASFLGRTMWNFGSVGDGFNHFLFKYPYLMKVSNLTKSYSSKWVDIHHLVFPFLHSHRKCTKARMEFWCLEDAFKNKLLQKGCNCPGSRRQF